MATLFPTNPTLNQQVVVGAVTYVWNGYAWVRPAVSPGFIAAVITATQLLYVSTTTNSTSTNSGALIVNGGVGIGLDVNVGGTITQQGSLVLTTASLYNRFVAGADISISTDATGIITVNDTSTLQTVTVRGATTDQAVHLTNTTVSTSTTTGALVVEGGVGVGGRLNAESIKIADTVFDSTLVSINTTATIVVDAYSMLDFRASKYLIQIDDNNPSPVAKFQVIELLLLVNNTGTVFATEYGLLTTHGELGSFAADVQNNIVRLYFTPTVASDKVISVMRTGMVS